MNKRIELIVLDPQNDFCAPSGALFVTGADDDMKRLAGWVNKNCDRLSDIHVTLDSHHKVDVAHPTFWRNREGKHPLALSQPSPAGNGPTIITSRDVKNGAWTPFHPSLIPRMIAYTEELERRGRFPLVIWGEHCLIGTPGAAVVPELMAAFNHWCECGPAMVDFITKGSNIFTEHYGAFAAEVPDPNDPSTGLNTPLIRTLEAADILFWAGEAASHCVLESMTQAFENFGPENIKKSVVLLDAMSCVPHHNGAFEKEFKSFMNKYKAMGLKTAKTTDPVV